MRAEAIEKEANLYDEDKACYIHVEKAPTSSQYASIMVGDSSILAQAIYNLSCEFAEREKMGPVKLFKFYIKMVRKIGINKPIET